MHILGAKILTFVIFATLLSSALTYRHRRVRHLVRRAYPALSYLQPPPAPLRTFQNLRNYQQQKHQQYQQQQKQAVAPQNGGPLQAISSIASSIQENIPDLSFMQKVVNFFGFGGPEISPNNNYTNKQTVQNYGATNYLPMPEYRNIQRPTEYNSQPALQTGQVNANQEDCSPCGSVPWIPIFPFIQQGPLLKGHNVKFDLYPRTPQRENPPVANDLPKDVELVTTTTLAHSSFPNSVGRFITTPRGPYGYYPRNDQTGSSTPIPFNPSPQHPYQSVVRPPYNVQQSQHANTPYPPIPIPNLSQSPIPPLHNYQPFLTNSYEPPIRNKILNGNPIVNVNQITVQSSYSTQSNQNGYTYKPPNDVQVSGSNYKPHEVYGPPKVDVTPIKYAESTTPQTIYGVPANNYQNGYSYKPHEVYGPPKTDPPPIKYAEPTTPQPKYGVPTSSYQNGYSYKPHEVYGPPKVDNPPIKYAEPTTPQPNYGVPTNSYQNGYSYKPHEVYGPPKNDNPPIKYAEFTTPQPNYGVPTTGNQNGGYTYKPHEVYGPPNNNNNPVENIPIKYSEPASLSIKQETRFNYDVPNIYNELQLSSNSGIEIVKSIPVAHFSTTVIQHPIEHHGNYGQNFANIKKDIETLNSYINNPNNVNNNRLSKTDYEGMATSIIQNVTVPDNVFTTPITTETTESYTSTTEYPSTVVDEEQQQQTKNSFRFSKSKLLKDDIASWTPPSVTFISSSGKTETIRSNTGSGTSQQKNFGQDVKKPKQIQIIIPYTRPKKDQGFKKLPKWTEKLQNFENFDDKDIQDDQQVLQESNVVTQTEPPIQKTTKYLTNIFGINLHELLKKELLATQNQPMFDQKQLQSKIDVWTEQEFSTSDMEQKASTISFLAPSKNIPPEYLTTTPISLSSGNDLEIYTTSTTESIAGNKETNIFKKGNGNGVWQKLGVTISPITHEKVHVVTPQRIETDDDIENRIQPEFKSPRFDVRPSPGSRNEVFGLNEIRSTLAYAVNNLMTTSTNPPLQRSKAFQSLNYFAPLSKLIESN